MARLRMHARAPGFPASPRVVDIAIHVHPCVTCGTLTPYPWFCIECRERGRPHVEDDPYDDLGGEGEPET
jgi:hypothetical protein